MKTLFVSVVVLCLVVSVLSDARHQSLHHRRRNRQEQTRTHRQHQHEHEHQQRESIKHHLSLQIQKANSLIKTLKQKEILDLWGHVWNQSPTSDKIQLVSNLFSGSPPTYLNQIELAKCRYVSQPSSKKSSSAKSFLQLYKSITSSSRTIFLEETVAHAMTVKSHNELYRFLMPEKKLKNHNKMTPMPAIAPEDAADTDSDHYDVHQEASEDVPPAESENESESESSSAPVAEIHIDTIEDHPNAAHETVQEQREDHLRSEGDSLKEIDGTPSITVGRQNSEEDDELATEPAVEVMFNGRATYFDNCGACTEPTICHDGVGVGANAAICVQFCSADSDCLYRYQSKLHRSFPGLCLSHLGFCHGFEYAADKAGAIASTQAIHSDWNKVSQQPATATATTAAPTTQPSDDSTPEKEPHPQEKD